jgi:secreted Zn-dependent insulinase-like peptidase
MLLVNYIKEPFFDKLRTEKQLAYYLRAYPKNTRGTLSLNFILISSNTQPRAISQYITEFCNTFLIEAEQDLTPEKFETIKKSVRTKTLEPHNSLSDYFAFVRREIGNQTFLFNRKERECLEQYLGNITR